MKGRVFFEKMTGISDEYVADAALPEAKGRAARDNARRRSASLMNALSSGWGVACICFIAGLSAVIGMVAWGRMGSAGVGPGVGTHGVQNPSGNPSSLFSFSYAMDPAGGLVDPGDTVTITATVVNKGAAFTYEGSSSEFCPHAELRWRGDDTVKLTGMIAHTMDIGTFTVEAGEIGSGTYIFQIPADTPEGVYDLVLSYKGSAQIFECALVVGDVAASVVPSTFTFGYTAGAERGGYLELQAWIINHGEPFTFEGSSTGYKPRAVLIHSDSGYEIEGTTVMTNDYTQFTVYTGQVGSGTYHFPITENTPAGSYDLLLSFGEKESRRFSSAVSIHNDASITVEDHFSFGYDLSINVAKPGELMQMKAWVVNEGAPFEFYGDPYSFQPTVTLWSMEDTTYTIQGRPAPTGVPPRECQVEVGDVGTNTYSFQIPVDAPEGLYGLTLSYYTDTGFSSLTVLEVIYIGDAPLARD